MSLADLSQKVAAQFCETGRHGLGSHIHGVSPFTFVLPKKNLSYRPIFSPGMLSAVRVEPDSVVAPERAAGARNDDSLATTSDPTLCDGDYQNGEKGPQAGALSTEKSAIGTDNRPGATASGIQIVTLAAPRFQVSGRHL